MNNLRDSNESVTMERWQLEELRKCAKDPLYFITNYVYINTKDHGMQLFKMWDFQKELLSRYIKYRFNIAKWPRQVGKSCTTMAYLLWYSLFNKEKVVVILANKLSLAQEQLQQWRDAYIALPYWMQPGVSTWAKREIRLSHGTRIKCAATSPDTVRGMSINVLFLDEFSFVKPHIADEFIASVFPTISSGQTTKVIMTSTPSGLNHFYRIWQDAKGDYSETTEGNGYVRSEVAWNAVPGRDEKWAREEMARIGEIRFNQEYKCINYNEMITIRSKKTKLIEKISIGDFYERLRKKHNNM